MLITRYTSAGAQRRGVILIVVLAMLTLFAIVGISFVMVANAQADSARLAREAENQFRPEIDPEAAHAFAMGQILYDVNDDAIGIFSGMRGGSLARNKFGWHPVALNDKPYNGTGKIRIPTPILNDPPTGWHNEAFLVNYTYFPASNDNLLRDPERRPRAGPGAALGAYVGGFNVPYTYPDHNNFYLAEINPGTGEIITPSFHREYLFGRLDQPSGTGAGQNPNWASRIGKYLTVRPRPAEHNGFPYPVDRRGDVKNLEGAPGGCDSIWIDINAPVMTAPDGRRYKMLVAPLILALDGRLDLNVVGNILGASGASRSNQGWGVWETNPAKVLDVNASEWQRLFAGSSAAGAAKIPGRYDNNPRRPLGVALGGGNKSRVWGQVDYNGMVEGTGAMSANYTLPVAPSTGSYYGFPDFPATTYGNGGAAENTDHPSISYFFNPVAPNRRFPLKDYVQLLRFGGTNSDMLTSDLTRLLPQNLIYGAGAAKRRNLVTLLSADLDRPGATPYIYNPNAAGANANDPADAAATRLNWQGLPVTPWTIANSKPIPYPLVASVTTNAGGEFDPVTWRSLSASLGRLNLNRYLTPYPAPAATGLIDTNDANYAKAVTERRNMAQEIFDALRKVTGAANPTQAYAGTFGAPGRDSKEFRHNRYLAQLAVNIVDYLDNDDYSTALNWFSYTSTGDANAPTTQEWVFGVEQPRLVVNESYVQLDNYIPDIELVNGVHKVKAAGKYVVNVWVELMNAMPDADAPYGSNTDLAARLVVNGQPAYRVLLCKQDTTLAGVRHPNNATGDPNWDSPATTRIWATMNDWPVAANSHLHYVNPLPSTNRFDTVVGAPAAPTQPQGFYVVGPNSGYVGETTYPDGTAIPAGQQWPLPRDGNNVVYPSPNNKLPVTHRSANMSYLIDSAPANVTTEAAPQIVLQRLANPGLPENNDKTSAAYNPFITIDLVDYTFTDAANGGVNDARVYDLADKTDPVPAAVADRTASGRRQPFAGAKTERRPQQVNPAADQPKHSFFRQNSVAATKAGLDAAANDATLKIPFDWLTHIDRAPISPVELMCVSFTKPAELTQFFVVNVNNVSTPHQHIAPWTDETSRLYRFLEFLTVGNQRTLGPAATPGGRTAGKVNLNLVWNREMLRALADAQTGNGFNEGHVDAIMANLIASRSPGSTYNGQDTAISLRPTDPTLAALAQAAGYVPDATIDRPFWGLAVGPADASATDEMGAAKRGIDNTVLRSFTDSNNVTAPLFDLPTQTHPYRRKELLNKVFNGVTTRSNVFGVWVTVGFFEVDAGGRLGAEMGKSENRHIRHRMFSIVDRTQMKAFETTSTGAVTAAVNQPVGLNPQGATNPPLQFFVRDARTGRDWQIRDGTTLTYDPDTIREETVTVRADATTGALTATFTQAHAAGCVVICRGNPGPWARYDPRQDTAVVPYFAVID